MLLLYMLWVLFAGMAHNELWALYGFSIDFFICIFYWCTSHVNLKWWILSTDGTPYLAWNVKICIDIKHSIQSHTHFFLKKLVLLLLVSDPDWKIYWLCLPKIIQHKLKVIIIIQSLNIINYLSGWLFLNDNVFFFYQEFLSCYFHFNKVWVAMFHIIFNPLTGHMHSSFIPCNCTFGRIILFPYHPDTKGIFMNFSSYWHVYSKLSFSFTGYHNLRLCLGELSFLGRLFLLWYWKFSLVRQVDLVKLNEL